MGDITYDEFYEEFRAFVIDYMGRYHNPYWRDWYRDHEGESVSVTVYWGEEFDDVSRVFELSPHQWMARSFEYDLPRAIADGVWELYENGEIPDLMPIDIDV